ncbi:hypothetical protein [Roseateles violae]
MSVWLSSTNRAINSARGQATAAAKRQVSTAQAEMVKQVIEFWSGKKTSSTKKGRR